MLLCRLSWLLKYSVLLPDVFFQNFDYVMLIGIDFALQISSELKIYIVELHPENVDGPHRKTMPLKNFWVFQEPFDNVHRLIHLRRCEGDVLVRQPNPDLGPYLPLRY